ncbi:retrovirus-related pol polyprotein from transposon TNT 1-94 [Tanacetum coccineum]
MESLIFIKFTKPSEDDITRAESERYHPDKYLHHFEPSQRYQVNNNAGEFIEPYEKLVLTATEVDAPLDQNDQADQNDHTDLKDLNHQNNPPVQAVESLNDITKPLSSLIENTSAPKAVSLIQIESPSSIPSMASSAPHDRWSKDKHIDLVNIIGNKGVGMLTRGMAKELSVASAHECLFVDFLSKEEPKKVSEALKHPGWVDAMQEELNQFSKNKVWTLVRAPYARLKEVWIFLAFATYMNFTVYQMDMKSAFLNGGDIKEVSYVKQPQFLRAVASPVYVCKLDKALYELKQAPRAWHETLSTFLTEHKFIKQSKRGISINQEKYVKDLLKKYDINGSEVKTPMISSKFLRNPHNPNQTCWLLEQSLGESKVSTSVLVFGIQNASGFEPIKDYKTAELIWMHIGLGKTPRVLMKSQLTDYDIIYEKVPIFCDNTSAIAISNNPVLHSRTKHVDIRHHFIRDHILKGDIELHFIPTQYQLADIFTKPLDEQLSKD